MRHRDPVSPPVYIGLLGNPRIVVGGEPVPLPGRHAGLVAATLLACWSEGETDRARLAETIWPESTRAGALSLLRHVLVQLRAALRGAACVLRARGRTTLALDVDASSCDVRLFDRAARSGSEDAMARAVEVWQGPLLMSSPAECLVTERESRKQQYVSMLRRLASSAAAAGDPPRALDYLERLLAVDPFDEAAVRAQMQCLSASGRFGESALVFHALRARLRSELGVDASAETFALREELRAGHHAGVGSVLAGRRLPGARGLGSGVFPRPVRRDDPRGSLEAAKKRAVQGG